MPKSPEISLHDAPQRIQTPPSATLTPSESAAILLPCRKYFSLPLLQKQQPLSQQKPAANAGKNSKPCAQPLLSCDSYQHQQPLSRLRPPPLRWFCCQSRTMSASLPASRSR